MEGKASYGSSSSSASSSSFSSELFGGGKELGSSGKSSSSSPGLFSTVFPPAASVMGRNSSHSDIFGQSRKQEPAGETWNDHNATTGGTSKGSPGKGQGTLLCKDRNSVYKDEKIDTCFLSSSLYYGGQDICTHPPGSCSSGSSYNYKKDSEDDSSSSTIDSRGNWWEGSLYY